jgi:hypothetical protein
VFEAVLVWSDYGFNNANELGNNLADYVDAGGGVVCAMFTVGSVSLSGRFHAENYWAIYPESNSSGYATLGTVYDNNHPILDNVESFNGGNSSWRPSTFGISDGATRVADWSDGKPLIATKQINGVNRADLGLFPPSSDISSSFWDSNTDGDLLMANSLLWVSGQVGHEWLAAEPDSGIIAAGSSQEIEIEFNAAELDTGLYDTEFFVLSNDPDEQSIEIPVHLDVDMLFPDIAVSPDSLSEELYVGDSATQVLTITNNGDADLDWEISFSSQQRVLGNFVLPPGFIGNMDLSEHSATSTSSVINRDRSLSTHNNSRSASPLLVMVRTCVAESPT